jgi:hypothetical protein
MVSQYTPSPSDRTLGQMAAIALLRRQPNMCDDCGEDKSEFLPVSVRVTNLLYLIDALGLNELELSDLSAGIYNRMDLIREITPKDDGFDVSSLVESHRRDAQPNAYDDDF